jgi:hypothetical protein
MATTSIGPKRREDREERDATTTARRTDETETKPATQVSKRPPGRLPKR